jgi:hypothetical protein
MLKMERAAKARPPFEEEIRGTIQQALHQLQSKHDIGIGK